MTQEELDFYNHNGYVLLSGVLTAQECAGYREELHSLARRLEERNRTHDATWGSATEGVAKGAPTQLKHCHDVQFHLASMSRLIVDPRITEPASQIIGPNVQLHHTKMFIKPPENGSPFPMHQDRPYFPHEKDSMIAAIVHFDDAPLEKGCVRVVPGSFKLGALEHQGDGGWHLPFSEFPVEGATPCPAKAGDVLFFSYMTIHGSGINQSDEARTTLLIQLRDPTDPPEVRTHESRGQGQILRGIDPLAPMAELKEECGAGVTMGGGMGGGMMGGMAPPMGGGMGAM